MLERRRQQPVVCVVGPGEAEAAAATPTAREGYADPLLGQSSLDSSSDIPEGRPLPMRGSSDLGSRQGRLDCGGAHSPGGCWLVAQRD